MKKIEEIQKKYYDLIEDYIGNYYKYMVKNNLTFIQTIKQLFDKKGHELGLAECQLTLESFNDELEKLWKNNYDLIISEVKKLRGIKTFNFFVPPMEDISHNSKNLTQELFSRVGLYTDSIILDDPMWRATTRIQEYETLFRFTKFLTYGFHMLNIKEIIFSDLDQPIGLICPSDLGDNTTKKSFQKITEAQIHSFSSALFQKEFHSNEEIEEYLNKNVKNLKDFLEITKSMYDKYSYFIESLKDLIPLKTSGEKGSRYYFEDGLPFTLPLDKIFSDIYMHLCYGYISYTNQVYYKSEITDSYPLFTERSVWKESNKYLLDNYILTNKYLKEKLPKNLIGLHVLTEDRFKWLGNVPVDLLVKIRKNGELNDFRLQISEKLNEYHTGSLENIETIAKDVEYTLNNSFRKHEKEIEIINKKYKYKSDTIGLIVSGVINITGAIFPPLSVLGTIVGGTSAIDIVRKYEQKKKEIKELKTRPIGILYDIHNQ